MIFKRQNAGGGNHVARLVLLELMTEHGLSASDIAEIQAELVPRRGIHHHSGYGESVLALAAVYGGVGLREAYNERYYNAPEVRAMQERVKISDRDEWGRV